jgi:ankyrin repeat protein
MKLLITTIAALLLVGCGAKAPDISIHKATAYGNIEAVKQHLAAGTDVSAKNEDGLTPLHHAAWVGEKEIAELLIVNGAVVDAKDYDGKPPLDWAANDTIDLLRKHGGKTGEELKAEGK